MKFEDFLVGFFFFSSKIKQIRIFPHILGAFCSVHQTLRFHQGFVTCALLSLKYRVQYPKTDKRQFSGLFCYNFQGEGGGPESGLKGDLSGEAQQDWRRLSAGSVEAAVCDRSTVLSGEKVHREREVTTGMRKQKYKT